MSSHLSPLESTGRETLTQTLGLHLSESEIQPHEDDEENEESEDVFRNTEDPITSPGARTTSPVITRTSSPTGPRTQFCCTQCDKVFLSETVLQVHIENVHGQEARTNSPDARTNMCNCLGACAGLCAVELQHIPATVNDNDIFEAISQEDLPTPKPRGPQKCTECGKICKTNYQLGVHMKKHQEDAGLDCPKCGKAFKTKHQKAGHMSQCKRQVDETAKEVSIPRARILSTQLEDIPEVEDIPDLGTQQKTKYPCTQCQKVYMSETRLMTHTETVHRLGTSMAVPSASHSVLSAASVSLTSSSQRFPCPQCDWTGANPGVVKTHIKKKHK